MITGGVSAEREWSTRSNDWCFVYHRDKLILRNKTDNRLIAIYDRKGPSCRDVQGVYWPKLCPHHRLY